MEVSKKTVGSFLENRLGWKEGKPINHGQVHQKEHGISHGSRTKGTNGGFTLVEISTLDFLLDLLLKVKHIRRRGEPQYVRYPYNITIFLLDMEI